MESGREGGRRGMGFPENEAIRCVILWRRTSSKVMRGEECWWDGVCMCGEEEAEEEEDDAGEEEEEEEEEREEEEVAEGGEESRRTVGDP